MSDLIWLSEVQMCGIALEHPVQSQPPTSSYREHVRQAQGLAAHPHPLRLLGPHLDVVNLHRCGHLLPLINES
jgi:hypothetical protein